VVEVRGAAPTKLFVCRPSPNELAQRGRRRLGLAKAASTSAGMAPRPSRTLSQPLQAVFIGRNDANGWVPSELWVALSEITSCARRWQTAVISVVARAGRPSRQAGGYPSLGRGRRRRGVTWVRPLPSTFDGVDVPACLRSEDREDDLGAVGRPAGAKAASGGRVGDWAPATRLALDVDLVQLAAAGGWQSVGPSGHGIDAHKSQQPSSCRSCR
jgi:hypothetical protein